MPFSRKPPLTTSHSCGGSAEGKRDGGKAAPPATGRLCGAGRTKQVTPADACHGTCFGGLMSRDPCSVSSGGGKVSSAEAVQLRRDGTASATLQDAATVKRLRDEEYPMSHESAVNELSRPREGAWKLSFIGGVISAAPGPQPPAISPRAGRSTNRLNRETVAAPPSGPPQHVSAPPTKLRTDR